MHKFPTYKSLGIIYILFLLSYLLLLFLWSRLQSDMVFAGGGKQKLELTGLEHFLLKDSEWNDISVVYYNQKAAKTVLYFHGNGWNLNKFAWELQYIAELGYNVLSYDYPGYGESTGDPTEEKVYEFSEKTYDYLTQKQKVAPENIILWGYSLGTAAAVDLATKRQINSLILIAPLTSLYDMAPKIFWLPLQQYLFLWNSFDSIHKSSNVRVPTLVIHGDNDSIVPYYMGKDIFGKLWTHRKYFVTIPGWGHQHVLEEYGSWLIDTFKDFLKGETLSENRN